VSGTPSDVVLLLGPAPDHRAGDPAARAAQAWRAACGEPKYSPRRLPSTSWMGMRMS
jgi:hypothetical protein